MVKARTFLGAGSDTGLLTEVAFCDFFLTMQSGHKALGTLF